MLAFVFYLADTRYLQLYKQRDLHCLPKIQEGKETIGILTFLFYTPPPHTHTRARDARVPNKDRRLKHMWVGPQTK